MTPSPRLVLASASPARRWLLESAGLAPEVVPSHVDEGGLEGLATAEAVEVLARRKADAVASRILASGEGTSDLGGMVLVLACDSLLEFEGSSFGKPASAEEAARRWRRFRGAHGVLHTGHVLLDLRTGRSVCEVDSAAIRFGQPTDEEVDAYAATEEALAVAGPFTLEGRSAPWIDSIDGNYGTVTGVSLAVLARLLRLLGLGILELCPS